MGKFVINKTKTGFTYALKATNGQTIAIGGEVYNTLDSVKNSCASVAKNAPVANIEDQTVENFETALPFISSTTRTITSPGLTYSNV